MLRKILLHSLDEGIKAASSLHGHLSFLEESAQVISSCFTQGGKLLLAGNGGSLCDAAHFAEELTGFFRKKRRALPAIVLNDPGHLTCVGNDVGFAEVFARGVEALGRAGDVFVGLSTSGNSQNLIRAFERAKDLDLKTIAFLGKGGGRLKGVADLELLIEGFTTSDRIQEAHMMAIHMIIEGVEALLFEEARVLEDVAAL